LPDPSQAGITQLLRAWGNGDTDALNRLTPIVYDALRRMARDYVRREGPENSVQATALVHEAYLKPSPRGSCVESWWTPLAPGWPGNGVEAR